MTDAARNPDDYCYRHPDRQSFIVCQRCGRTICPECQTPAAVGVHCPECVKEARAQYRESQRFTSSGARRAPGFVRRLRGASASGTPVVTYAIMAICVLVWVLELLPGIGPIVQNAGVYAPIYSVLGEPWRMLTNIFLHSTISFLHLPLNMLSLYFIGPTLESMLGRWRYLALYLIAGFGGSVAVLLIAPATSGVLGASGAIFGLMGAYFIIVRRLGQNGVQILVFLGLNLLIGFIVPSIAWQAHIGGAVVGAAVAAVMMATRDRRRRVAQIGGVAGVAAMLIVLTVVGTHLVANQLAS